MTELQTAAANPSRSVSPPRCIALTYKVVLRDVTTTGRILALTLLALVAPIAGLAFRMADNATFDDAVRLIATIGLAGVVPIVALVFGGAALGDLREDKTLVYLWLRPMDRWPIVVGAALAAITIAAPISLIPLVAAAALTGLGGSLVTASLAASAVGLVAYIGIFTLLGVWLRRFIVWGLAYILIWEGFIAQAGIGVARFAIRRYTRSILVEVTDSTAFVADFGLLAAVIVPLAAAAAALALAAWRLRTQDID